VPGEITVFRWSSALALSRGYIMIILSMCLYRHRPNKFPKNHFGQPYGLPLNQDVHAEIMPWVQPSVPMTLGDFAEIFLANNDLMPQHKTLVDLSYIQQNSGFF
jgi:hypothetical protein